MSSIGPARRAVRWARRSRRCSCRPSDMALVELAQLNESRIAVLLGVPPFLVGLPSGGDSMTYSNVTSLFDYHWRAGLRPKAHAVMAALSAWLLPRGTTIEVNRDEYVQPGPYERAQTAGDPTTAYGTTRATRSDRRRHPGRSSGSPTRHQS